MYAVRQFTTTLPTSPTISNVCLPNNKNTNKHYQYCFSIFLNLFLEYHKEQETQLSSTIFVKNLHLHKGLATPQQQQRFWSIAPRHLPSPPTNGAIASKVASTQLEGEHIGTIHQVLLENHGPSIEFAQISSIYLRCLGK